MAYCKDRQRIDHGVDHCGRRPDRAGLAGPFMPSALVVLGTSFSLNWMKGTLLARGRQ